jgi:hypothetical protein
MVYSTLTASPEVEEAVRCVALILGDKGGATMAIKKEEEPRGVDEHCRRGGRESE